MRPLAGLILAGLLAAPLIAQEKPVPTDSARVTLTGCARNSLFVVRWLDDHEPRTGEVEEGRRFRMAGNKEVLKDVKQRQRNMVELTGLIRKNDLNPPRGINIGGRVRVGIGDPRASVGDPARSQQVGVPVLDVESFRPLPNPCSDK